MKKDLWVIAEVTIYDLEIPHKTLITLCPKDMKHIADCEALAMPLEEYDFWKSMIGKAIDFTGIEMDIAEDGNPIWDIEELQKRLDKAHGNPSIWIH